MTIPARIRRLTLTNFRSYHAAQVAVGDGPAVLVGPNGAGKTNVLEAISFLAPGRGLRRATLDEVAFSEGDGAWAVSAEVEGALGLATLGTGIEPPPSEEAAPVRQCRVDREPDDLAAALVLQPTILEDRTKHKIVLVHDDTGAYKLKKCLPMAW